MKEPRLELRAEDRVPVILHDHNQLEADTSLCDGSEPETVTLRVPDFEDDDDDDDDDGEDDDDDDESHQGIEQLDHTVRRKWTVGACCRSKPCSVCLYLILVLILLSSTVALVVIGILVVAPYHRANRYLETNCTTVRVDTDRTTRRCSCGKGCNSQYPCLRIMVSFDANTQEPSKLADDESLLHRKVSVGRNGLLLVFTFFSSSFPLLFALYSLSFLLLYFLMFSLSVFCCWC